MPALAGGVASGGPEVMMTGVFGRGHFQIGWFEDVDAVLDLEAARAQHVDVFRRPIWGGGTAFYDTNASALLSYFIRPDRFPTLDDALEHLRPAMARALEDLGLGEARFEGSSDVRWRGRKLGTLIAQSMLGTAVVGGFFNLRKPDLDLYRRIAHPPEEKFSDKAVKDMVAYLCTPAEVRGRDLSYEEFRDAVVSATREVAGLVLEPSAFTRAEEEGTAGFVRTVGSESWIRQVSSVVFRGEAPPEARVGFANHKGKKLVRAGLALGDDGTIVRAMVAGDMHISPPDAMVRVAAALEGGRSHDRDDLLARVRVVLADPEVSQPERTAGITADDVVEAVLLAAKGAE
jgi:lipoate-protein ligase A